MSRRTHQQPTPNVCLHEHRIQFNCKINQIDSIYCKLSVFHQLGNHLRFVCGYVAEICDLYCYFIWIELAFPNFSGVRIQLFCFNTSGYDNFYHLELKALRVLLQISHIILRTIKEPYLVFNLYYGAFLFPIEIIRQSFNLQWR